MSTSTEIAKVTKAKKPSSRKSQAPHATGQVTRETIPRKRARMTAAQLEVLLPIFELQPTPTRKTKHALAAQLNIPYHNVLSWFQYKRKMVARSLRKEMENQAPKELVINTLCRKRQEIGFGEDDEQLEAAKTMLMIAQRGVIFGSKDNLGMVTSTSTDGR